MRHRSHGIVLVIALIMLAMISLLAAWSLRNASSSESVSSVVRVTELATQAADIALRHCEAAALSPSLSSLALPSDGASPAPSRWQEIQTWDRASDGVVVLPLEAVNQGGSAKATFRRPPECLIEPLPIAQKNPAPPEVGAEGLAAGATATAPRIWAFVVTARGFGPEVPAEPPHGRPQGTEVWLQSHLELGADPVGAPRVLWRAWRQLFMR